MTLQIDTDFAQRTTELVQLQRRSQCQATDSMFGLLMLFQWVAALSAACWITPQTWLGETFVEHQHIWTAVFWGPPLPEFRFC